MIRNTIQLCICLSVMFCSAASRADEGAIFDIPRLDDIVIDGDAGDWGDRGFLSGLLADTNGRIKAALDQEVRFRLGWDERGLLVLVNVRDNLFMEPENVAEIWSQDMVEVYVAPNRGSDEQYQIVFAPGMAAGYPKIRTVIYDRRKTTKSGEEVTFTAQRTKAKNLYTMEILLPWSNLKIKPEKGREIAFQIMSCDADVIRDRHSAFWYPATGTGEDSRKMHRVRLAASPSPMKLEVASGHVSGWRPRVRVTGPKTLSGSTIQVKKGEELLASGKLAVDGERAWLELALPYPKPGVSLGELQVFRDGEQIATVNIPKADLPKLAIAQTSSQLEGVVKLRVELAPLGDEFPDAPAKIQAFDASGAEVASAVGHVGQELSFKLSDGLYRLQAQVSDFHGQKLIAKGACLAGKDAREILGSTVRQARKLQAGPISRSYLGWLDYLASLIENELSQPELMPSTVDLALQLTEWQWRFENETDPLKHLRGMNEWAYLSSVDGSGQPFMIEVPADYDPNRQYPLTVNLHSSGNIHNVTEKGHAEVFYMEDGFNLRPAGRAQAGGYSALPEADVLDAIAYVRRHWNIDPDRIHVNGGSMGGGGSFWFPSRFPDLFASARSLCGYGLRSPLENMAYVPIYSLHGRDDPIVPVSMSRAAIRLLAQMGYEAVQDEADGFGHHIEKYKEGTDKSREWAYRHVRPQNIRRVRYTATDELARRAYWVEVVEWGGEGRPATINARLGAGNALYLTLDNVGVARIDLAASPADKNSSMAVVIDGYIEEKLPSPLPDAIFVSQRESAWHVSAEIPKPPAERLHYPGGAMALFHGEPIMIVWGTQGDDETNKAIFEVAQDARRSCRASWPKDSEVTRRMVFGGIPGKADTEVTQADFDRYNLVLIGTAEQNSIVAKLADKLPVKIDANRVNTADGFSWDFKDRAMGLLYYNPAAPKRLVYWVASQSHEFYRPGARLMTLQSWGMAPPDFMIMHATSRQIVAARRFDSRWRWEAGYGDSPLMPDSFCTQQGAAKILSDAICRETVADFAIQRIEGDPQKPAYSAGETRKMDVVAGPYSMRIAAMDLTGKEILDREQSLRKRNSGFRFLPDPRKRDIQPERLYRVAMQPWLIWSYAKQTGSNPESFRLLDATVRSAFSRHLAAP